MKEKLKTGLLLLLFSSLLLAVPALFKRWTCGFKLAKMDLAAPFRPEWEIESALSPAKLHAILDRPYLYLGQGAQCYVFQDASEEHVIKLFRYDRPQLIGRKKRGDPKMKWERLFSASILAYEKARQETGLLYLHLNLTANQLPTLKLKGPLGQTVRLPLDRYRFAIQKKAAPFRQSLLDSIRANDAQAVRNKIDSFVELLRSRTAKGIGNSDPTLSRNFGFFHETAVEIDFGNYYENPPNTDQEIEKYTNRLRRWLKREAPEWVFYLDDQLIAR